MAKLKGTLGRNLTFGDMTAVAASLSPPGRAGLRLAQSARPLRGPDKYKVLEHRRRRAQIKARRLLDFVDWDSSIS